MSRDFNIVRRRPNLVDLTTPKREGVEGYRFDASRTFSGTFSTLFTASIGRGYLDPAVDPSVLHTIPGSNHVRAVFDPDTFRVPHLAELVDSEPFWLQFVPIDFSAAAGTAGSPSLVIPDSYRLSQTRVVFTGDAPNASDVSGSLQLEMPFRMQNWYIRNNETSGGNSLFVAASPNGAEREVLPQETLEWFDGAQGTVLVRGAGGTVSATFDATHYLPL